MIKAKKGFTLMELMVAIPMIAVIGIAAAQLIASYAQASTSEMKLTKCRIAADNILTFLSIKKKEAHFRLGNIDLNTDEYKKLKPDDGNYTVSLKKTEDKIKINNVASEQNEYLLSVSLGEEGTVVKTYFPASYFDE